MKCKEMYSQGVKMYEKHENCKKNVKIHKKCKRIAIFTKIFQNLPKHSKMNDNHQKFQNLSKSIQNV